MNPIFDFDVKGQIFNFKLYPNELKNNLYKYKYYDTIEKKKTENKTDFVQMRLFDNYMKIEYIFVRDSEDGSKVANAMFRDRNSIFVKDKRTNKWYGTNADVFLEATNYAITKKENFSATELFWDYYVVRKKGNGYVVGSEDEYKKLPRHQKHLMLIYITTKTIIVLLRDIDFFVPNTYIIRSRFPKSVLARCRIKQLVYKLNDDDKKQLNALYPNFSFNS